MKRASLVFIALSFGAIAARSDVEQALELAGPNRGEIAQALEKVPDDEATGMRFLVAHMPERDLKQLSAKFLLENVSLAYKARKALPWGATVPEPLFLNDVLPYASINERRDNWRADFYERFRPIVAECKSPGEAAHLLNRDIFKLLDVQYHARKRPKPDQSPYESIEAKYASCTGLSILLIDACRALCIPARFVGTPMWANKRGNHSWVEVWSDGKWHWTGACEHNPKGLDKVWFLGDAAHAQRDVPYHAIYATTWKRTGIHFPMIWAPTDASVAAVNITDRYAKSKGVKEPLEGETLLGIQVWDRQGGERIKSHVRVRQGEEVIFQGISKDTSDDTNNVLEVILKTGKTYEIDHVPTSGGERAMKEFTPGKEKRQRVDLIAKPVSGKAALKALETYLAKPRNDRPALDEAFFARAALSKSEAEAAINAMWEDHARWIRESRAEEMERKAIMLGDKIMRFEYKVFGEKPDNGRRLFISMHGGGNTRPEVNDRQWANQLKLYEPEEGIYLAPRAPTDTWNLWHQAHIDVFFDRLIENLIVFEDVDPNRVYLTGYSAGGDGVYQLAPRMADRFAAAAMMAGHPNEAKPLGLRNIGFALHMGANDKAYKRNEVAVEWSERLGELAKKDSGGYLHQVVIHSGKGHWMDGEDRMAIPWMAEFARQPFPKRVVWYQDDVTHRRFYWLRVSREQAKRGHQLAAECQGQRIDIQSDDITNVDVLLSDSLLDLGQPVEVVLNGKTVFKGEAKRTIASIAASLRERPDPKNVAVATVRHASE